VPLERERLGQSETLCPQSVCVCVCVCVCARESWGEKDRENWTMRAYKAFKQREYMVAMQVSTFDKRIDLSKAVSAGTSVRRA